MSLPRLCLALLVTVVSLTAAQPPNVVFIFADDQRADTIAALGNPVIKTPNLDRLVKRGVAFTRAYMQGGNQGATCVPQRTMTVFFPAARSAIRSGIWLTKSTLATNNA